MWDREFGGAMTRFHFLPNDKSSFYVMREVFHHYEWLCEAIGKASSRGDESHV